MWVKRFAKVWPARQLPRLSDWHDCHPFWPLVARLIDGRWWIFGLSARQLQRRWRDGAWEYRVRKETQDEFINRQW